MFQKKKITEQQALSKLTGLCARAEHCSGEMLDKLRQWRIDEEAQARIMEYLIKNKFVDDERYAQSYIRGKVGLKQWGKQKIRMSLLQKGIPKELIDKYLEHITPQQYTDNLQAAVRKWTQSHGPVTQENITKLYRHLMAKGYTYEEIKRVELKTEN